MLRTLFAHHDKGFLERQGNGRTQNETTGIEAVRFIHSFGNIERDRNIDIEKCECGIIRETKQNESLRVSKTPIASSANWLLSFLQTYPATMSIPISRYRSTKISTMR